MKFEKAHIRGVVLLLGVAGALTAEAAEPLNWVWRSRPITGNSLYSIAASGDAVVATGRLGTIIRGTTSGAWSVVEADIQSHYEYGSVHLSRVHYDNGLFVAGGDTGSVLTSPDGWTWTRETTPNVTFGSDLCVDGPNWIALGDDSNSNGFVTTILFRQSDGSWSKLTPPQLEGMKQLAYGQGKWIAVGNGTQWASSTDGTNWTLEATSLPNSATMVAYANGLWLAVGSEVMTSTNAIDWNQISWKPTGGITSMRHINDRWILVGGMIADSADGSTWTSHSGPTANDVAFAGGSYYLCDGGGNIYRSYDLDNWENLNPQVIAGDPGSSEVTELHYANNQMVGIGSGDFDIFESTDGVNWSLLKVVSSGPNFTGLTYGDGKWVAVQGQNVWQSTDGLNWSMTTPPEIQNDLQKVAYGNGVWVATSFGGIIYRSSDLLSWSSIPPATSSLDVFFANGTFVSGKLISSDGQNWGPLDDPAKEAFAYEDGYWFANDDQKNFYRSTSLKDWESLNCSWLVAPSQIFHFNGRWLAFGGYEHQLV
ncbi:hypothetical protein GC207_12595 [bacterium]|nr:hypothetical protein [bacterium]